jgi:hypothetical protein
MSTRGEKSLATRAKQNIGICCETLCDREPVQQYIKELEDKVAFYEEKEQERYNIRMKERAKALYEKG